MVACHNVKRLESDLDLGGLDLEGLASVVVEELELALDLEESVSEKVGSHRL
jgi:hypothetical protein